MTPSPLFSTDLTRLPTTCLSLSDHHRFFSLLQFVQAMMQNVSMGSVLMRKEPAVGRFGNYSDHRCTGPDYRITFMECGTIILDRRV